MKKKKISSSETSCQIPREKKMKNTKKNPYNTKDYKQTNIMHNRNSKRSEKGKRSARKIPKFCIKLPKD